MSIKVLVVEDEEAISHLLKYNLTAEGFDVTVVDDGDDALMAAEDFQPDIILLDWMLPHVSGIEICRQLRARKEPREIPVIMLTARAEEEDRLRGRASLQRCSATSGPRMRLSSSRSSCRAGERSSASRAETHPYSISSEIRLLDR